MPDEKNIVFSKYTVALIENLKQIKSKSKPDEISKIAVSQTVSFFGIVYEKIRNAIEYREDHLIRSSEFSAVALVLTLMAKAKVKIYSANFSGRDIFQMSLWAVKTFLSPNQSLINTLL